MSAIEIEAKANMKMLKNKNRIRNILSSLFRYQMRGKRYQKGKLAGNE
ncbi:MAG: hypothetical protein WCG27_13620 [Pseudomonadota bacterium]